MLPNAELRLRIARIIKQSGEGHIPSSYSIIDIIAFLYSEILRVDPQNPDWEDRDYFVLSKGHGSSALYVVLNKMGFLTDEDLETYGTLHGKLGGHPDVTQVSGVEASTGSLGHGFPTAVGIALGLKIKGSANKVYVLVGDGECHEGTIWESAHVARNLGLGNLYAVVDWNGSAEQLMPFDQLPEKWRAFGWNVRVVDGHSDDEMRHAFTEFDKTSDDHVPKIIVAKTIKGKGVSFIEGHGLWHHRIPTDQEMLEIERELVR